MNGALVFLLSREVREGDFVGYLTMTHMVATVHLVRVTKVDGDLVLFEGEEGDTDNPRQAVVDAMVSVREDGCTTVNFLTTLHCDFRREYEGFAQALTEARRVAARELGGVAWSEYERG